MHKLVPVLTILATLPVSAGALVAADLRSAGPFSDYFAGTPSPSNAVVLIGGMGGSGTGGGMGGGGKGGGSAGGGSAGDGMGGGSAGGGMGGGSTASGGMGGTTGGGMGGGSAGGMGGGATTGGMGTTSGGGTGGGMTGFGGMTGAAGGFGTTGGGSASGNNAEPAYYTYQCVTAGGQCSFTAPAALRSSSLQAGARCACAVGQPEGQIR
jgi:hypothetical protein